MEVGDSAVRPENIPRLLLMALLAPPGIAGYRAAEGREYVPQSRRMEAEDLRAFDDQCPDTPGLCKNGQQVRSDGR